MRMLVVGIAAIALWLLVGCGEDSTTPGDQNPIMSIDDEIVLKGSARVGVTSDVEWVLDFDVHALPMYVNADFNAIRVNYGTATSCDEDRWIYDFRQGGFKQFAFDDSMALCLMGGGCFWRLVSPPDYAVKDCITEDGMLRVKAPHFGTIASDTTGCSYSVTLLKLDQRYIDNSVSLAAIWEPQQLAYDGETFWVYDSETRTVFRLGKDGAILRQLRLEADSLRDIAYWQGHLWIMSSRGFISKIAENGAVICQFPAPTIYVEQMAFGSDKLYLAELTRNEDRIFTVDPMASCSTGHAVITDSITNINMAIHDFACDRGNLYSLSGSDLVRIMPDGSLAPRGLPCAYPMRMTVASGIIWLMHTGPGYVTQARPVLTGFRLPD